MRFRNGLARSIGLYEKHVSIIKDIGRNVAVTIFSGFGYIEVLFYLEDAIIQEKPLKMFDAQENTIVAVVSNIRNLCLCNAVYKFTVFLGLFGREIKKQKT